MADAKLSALSEISVPALEDLTYLVDDPSGTPVSDKASLTRLLGLLPSICDGRLTLTSGTPVTTADVTAATNIYFTPYVGDRISIYDGTRWRLYLFTELTLALGTITAALPYDVFIYDDNAGTLTLELLAWTNGTTRATALVRQNGVWCKTGALTRRYLGTFYTTATTTTEDSAVKRFLWNAYSQVTRPLFKNIAAAHTYTGVARSWNNSTAHRLEIVTGLAERPLDLLVAVGGDTGGGATGWSVGFGQDSTSAFMTHVTGPRKVTSNLIHTFHDSIVSIVPSIGYHFYQALEQADGTWSTGESTSTISGGVWA